MHILYLVLFCLLCGAANVARGEKLFGLTDSTVMGRIFSMTIIAGLSAGYAVNIMLYPIILGGLLIWCTPAWDNYWSAAIGNQTDIKKKAFMPVDVIMKAFAWFPARVWGLVAMGLRGFICIYPLFIALGLMGYREAYYIGFASILQGLPYFLYGLQKNKGYVIAESEFTWGCCIGLMLHTVLS